MARKILLADDSVTAQNMGRKILADAGYEVITVNNGSAALKKIAEQKPDLVVLDVYMPGYSGLEVCQRLKETAETSRLPILLTVGKLEPFKPEEAKRVRADGFIVKPFEASELLSALSKLEDKIVPRAESSKPGRFARVTAEIEGRYDKTVAIEEDTGWKDRIAFPSKKKKAVPEESPADYVASQEEKRPAKLGAKTDEPRVDLGALAPEGLPKDVTPEEIAALAAAAAQVKGKLTEQETLEPPPVPEWAQKEQAAAGASSEQLSDAAELAAKVEEKKFEETPTEKIEATQDSVGEAARSNSELMAAITSLESKAGDSVVTGPPIGSSAQETVAHASEPVTMAVAGADGARWTAVSVALGPEDAAISLEQEMQKAYAAFAAVENGFAASVAASSATESEPSTARPSAPESAVAESIPAIPAPEVAQSLSELASASTDAIRAAVQELETVAESFVGGATAPVESAPASASQSDAAPEAAKSVEVAAKENPVTEVPQEAAKSSEPEQAEPKHQEVKSEREDQEDKKATEEVQKVEEPLAASVDAVAQPTSPEAVSDVAVPTAAIEVSGEQVSASPDSVSAGQDSPVERAGATEKGADGKKEPDESANTAAAWASWRRIRESGESKESAMQMSKEEAMAVAAGAEKAAAEASDSDPEAIASIVDSVLADLRPKIFEEISRKMGKKK